MGSASDNLFTAFGDFQNAVDCGLRGEITIPPDKSISHRSLIIGALASASLNTSASGASVRQNTKGKIKIENFSSGADCHSTLKIMKQLGVEIEFLDEKTLLMDARNGFSAPSAPLDCGNSGTTMRLMSGVLAGQNFDSVLIGDESLSKRPMMRVIEPLEAMGAKIESNSGRAPLKIHGKDLAPAVYNSKISSAQVKSCVLLAGLNVKNADTPTIFTEPHLSRDHSEKMLGFLGAKIETAQKEDGSFETKIWAKQLTPQDITIVGDISSAAFFLIMGAIVPKSEIVIKNVGLNPTRTGILDVLENMGADFEILDKKTVSNEPVGDIKIKYSPDLKGIEIGGEIIPRLIDELPAIAVLATQAEGTTTIKDAGDLRNKESDRIKAVVAELQKLGANIAETQDGFIIEGKNSQKGLLEGVKTAGGLEVYHDHRLAMSWFLAGLVCKKPFQINGFNWVNTSFPEFLDLFKKLCSFCG